MRKEEWEHGRIEIRFKIRHGGPLFQEYGANASGDIDREAQRILDKYGIPIGQGGPAASDLTQKIHDFIIDMKDYSDRTGKSLKIVGEDLGFKDVEVYYP